MIRSKVAVIPAQAGIPPRPSTRHWIPACAGMTRLSRSPRGYASCSRTSASLAERTLAGLQRRGRLIRGDRRAQLVEIPVRFRFRWLLDLEQVRRVDLAPVDADRSLAEQRVVGRHLFHL